MGFYSLVPVEDTFFKSVDIPKGIKLSKEIVLINYSHLSPFPDGDVIFYRTKNSLYLWFVRYKLKSRVNIPEGYIIYKQFKDRKNAITIVEKKRSFVFSVIKNGELVSQFSLSKSVPVNIDERVEFLKREHSLKQPDIIKKSISDIKTKPDLTDILKFSHFSLDRRSIQEFILEEIKIPIILILVGLSIYDIFLLNYLSSLKEEKVKVLQELKKENQDIKNLLMKLEEKRNFWKRFISEEFKFENLYNVASAVASTLKKYEGTLKSFNSTENMVDLWIESKVSSSKLIDELLKTGYFEEIKVLSSVRPPQKEDIEIINMQLFLKEKKTK